MPFIIAFATLICLILNESAFKSLNLLLLLGNALGSFDRLALLDALRSGWDLLSIRLLRLRLLDVTLAGTLDCCFGVIGRRVRLAFLGREILVRG
jgi:hypothetical protein